MAGPSIAVVTDSTSYLPGGLAEDLAVTVVPLHVSVGENSGCEGTEVSPADVARALAERRGVVRTSRPSPQDFVEAYQSCLSAGAAGVVSVHLSRELSGTWESARMAAKECGGEPVVRVVDSRSTAMGLGFAVIAAAHAARGGGDLEKVYTTAMAAVERITSLFYVDTLEHLRRGGRIGAAQALLGTALSVKPILTVQDGRIVLKEKVRTASKAVARLEALVAEIAVESTVDIAVQHLAAAERAEQLAARLRERVPSVRDLYISEVGAVVGAHVGPGLLGVAVSEV